MQFDKIRALFFSNERGEKYNVGNLHFENTLASRFKTYHTYGLGHEHYNELIDLKDIMKFLFKPDVIFFMLPGSCFEKENYLTKFDYSVLKIPKILYDTDPQRHIKSRCDFINRNQIDYLFLGNSYKFNKEHESLIDVPCKVVWLPFGVDMSFFTDCLGRRMEDVLFLGNTRLDYYPDRSHMIGTMRRVFGEKFFHCGDNDKVKLISYVSLLNNYKVFAAAGDLTGGFFMKNLEAMACGCLLISQYTPCFDRLGFVSGKHLLLWKTFRELVDLTEYYLENDAARKEIAFEGRDFVLNNHTWDHRVDTLLNVIKEKKEG